MAFEILYDADDNIMGFSELDPKTLEISDGTKWIHHNGDRIMKRVLGYDQVIYLSSYMNKELDTALDDALLKEIDKQKEKEFFDNKDSALNIPISQLKRKKPSIKEMPPFNGSSEFDSKLFDALHKKDNTIIVKPNSGIIHTGPIGDYNTSFYDSKLNNTKSFNQNEINCLLK